MDKLVEETTINGKKVRCILIFDKYNKRKYQNDFGDFINYQTKKEFNKETLPGELDLKFYNLKDFVPIPYETFKKFSILFLSRVFFEIIKENPSIIHSEELNLQLKILRIPNRSYYFEQDESIIDPENAIYTAAGFWFIQTIVAPYVYFKKIDYAFIKRYFAHELLHYSDLISGYMAFETKYPRLKMISRRLSNYSMNYLQNSIYNLRFEGLADFVTRKDSNVFEIDMEGIKEYNQNLNKLITMKFKKDAEKFYVKNIGWENLTPCGEYANGRMMCIFIIMHIAKMMKSNYAIVIGNQKMEGYEFNELNNILSSNRKIKVMNFSKQIFDESTGLIQKNDVAGFLKLYESACNNLGISDKNRIMTRKRLGELQIKAINFAKQEKMKRLRKKGYENY